MKVISVPSKLRIKGTTNLVEIKNGKKPNTCLYSLKRDGKTVFQKEGSLPLSLGATSSIGKEIKKLIDPDSAFKPEALNQKYRDFMLELSDKYVELLESEKEEHEKQVQREIEDLSAKKEEASRLLRSIEEPVVWLGSLLDWAAAHERNNILLCFFAYASQVVLGEPISVICLGESSSGKTKIQQEALNLIPTEFVLNEKKITEAALFNRAKENEFFYDGKIVNYGDMGGANDQSFMEDSKALMKELQSDGYLNKPLNVKEGDGWVVEDLKLKGSPSLTYTTVPGYSFDDQELSRSIFITPRTDNKKPFQVMISSLELKGTSYHMEKSYRLLLDKVKYMVYDLKEKLDGVEVINPYINILINYLSGSKYYKRDFPKLNGLLKSITAFNYYNHKVYDINGESKIYVTYDDLQLFFSLLDSYKLSYVTNLSPVATRILQDLIDNFTDIAGDDEDSLIPGVTIADYFEYNEKKLSKKSIRNYFKELDEQGFIKELSGKQRYKRYTLVDSALDNTSPDLELSQEAVRQLKHELLRQEIEIVLSDEIRTGVDVSNQHSDINVPLWCEDV